MRRSRVSLLLFTILMGGCAVAAAPSIPTGPGEVLVLVRVTARAGLGDTVADRFRNPQGRCTEQVGCLGFEILRPHDDPDRVMALERWASVDAHRAFFEAATSAPQFQSFLALLRDGLHYEYLRTHPPRAGVDPSR